MRYLLLFIASFLFAFEVEFNETFTKFIIPNQTAILISKPIEIKYSPKIYIPNGVVLLNYENANQFIRNDFYVPADLNITDVKIYYFDIDIVRNEVIQELSKKYTCNIKKIIFNNQDYKQIYFKPTLIKIKSLIFLECNK